jgi:nucleoside-diphosphate-sugar epimerase
VSEEEARERPLMWGAPPHPRLGPPHEWLRVDAADYAAVERAVEGCDAVINLSVVRWDASLAFRVNAFGTWNVLRAAVRHGVRRVIHTGPIWIGASGFDGDGAYEFDIDPDAPYRSGSHVYPLSKHLSFEIADAFAREHDLDVMTFLFAALYPRGASTNPTHGGRALAVRAVVAWEELGAAFLAGLRVPRLERGNERFYICAQTPLAKIDVEKTERLLGWRAEHAFEQAYRIGTDPERRSE